MKTKIAFTLVELIVVVTIIAILSTIWFISFSWYLAGTRDTNRTWQLKALSDALEIYRIKDSLPLPDAKVDVRANWKIMAYQWYIGKNVLSLIQYTESWLDPKDKKYFTYYLTRNRKVFQLMALLEEPSNDNLSLWINKTYASDYSNRYIYVKGKKLWIITDLYNTPIQENSTIVWSGYLDIVKTKEPYKLTVDNSSFVTWTGLTLASFSNNATCKRLKIFEWINNNWIYTINPTWHDEYKAYCNMKLGWGWWTLIATTADDWRNTWTYNNRDLLKNTTTTWSLNKKEKDFKSKAYSQIKFKDMMFEDKQWEWWAYDDINPAYNQTVAEWMPMTLVCPFWNGRDYYMTSWSVSINKWVDDTQQDRWLFFSVYDNEWGCDPSSSSNQNAIWPTWWYRNNAWLSPDDPGAMWWWITNWKRWDTHWWYLNREAWDARLWRKTYVDSETNDWDYIYWYVR